MIRSMLIGLLIAVFVMGATVLTQPVVASAGNICCNTTYASCVACCPSSAPVWKDDGSNNGNGSCWPVGQCPMSGGMCYPCSQLKPCS